MNLKISGKEAASKISAERVFHFQRGNNKSLLERQEQISSDDEMKEK